MLGYSLEWTKSSVERIYHYFGIPVEGNRRVLFARKVWREGIDNMRK
jgi:hypothetical protein